MSGFPLNPGKAKKMAGGARRQGRLDRDARVQPEVLTEKQRHLACRSDH
jgi:hypothetical protein